MARPKEIADIHAAKYDLRSCAGSAKEMFLDQYRKALRIAAEKFKATGPQIEAVIASDFGKWMKEQKLPPLPPSAPTKE